MGQKDESASYESPMSDNNNFKNEFMASEKNSHRYRRMKRNLSIMAILLGLAVVAIIIMGIFLVKYSEELQGQTGTNDVTQRSLQPTYSTRAYYGYRNLCLTKGCLDAAIRIHRFTDPSVDPCDDFYQFACGGWERLNSIAPGETQFTAVRELQVESRFAVRDVLLEDKKASDPGYVNKLKDFYTSCLNQDYNRDDLQDLKDVIQTRFGGWPLALKNWDESSISLEEAAVESSRLGVSAILDFSVIPFLPNKTMNLLRANQPTLFTLGYKEDYRGFERDDPKFLALEDRIVEIARMFGDIDETSAREDAVALVTFERELALKVFVRSAGFVSPIVLSRWQTDYSSEMFDWKTFFETAIANPDVGIYDLTEDEIIYRGPDTVFIRIRDLLLDTPKRTVVNFIVWRVIDTYWDIASNNQTNKELNQMGASAAREKDCLESVTIENDLNLASNQIFIDERFSPRDKDMVINMIPVVKKAMKELMDELDWIDEDTLRMTKEKLDCTKARIGFPETIYNDEYLENYYSNVSFTSNNYLKNLFTLRRDAWMKMTRRLRVPNDDDFLWMFLPIIVNAFNDVTRNTIEFPAAIFQLPYFSGQNPKSLNFGGIGSIIGHELTHGFDRTGVQFNKNGTGGTWWSSSAIESLNNQSNCLVEQYNNFFVKEANMTVNGRQTLNENLADNAGVRQGFKAYRNWVESEYYKEEPIIPGLPYTHDQLFFIGRAHIYCSLMTTEAAVQFVQFSQYSPSRFRINGPNKNSEDFAKAFDCPLNSNMNPAEKCVVW